MPKNFEIDDCGTLRSWEPYGIEVIFPVSEIEIGGVTKTRGGGHICLPYGNEHIHLPEYAGLDIPQHGLARIGGHSSLTRVDRAINNQKLLLRFDRPSWHDVEVSANSFENDTESVLDHAVHVIPGEPLVTNFGFHPYFATHGNKFTVEVDNRELTDSDKRDDLSKGILIPLENAEDRRLCVSIENVGDIFITLPRFTAEYTGFVVWSDSPEHYICAEPVMKEFHHMEAGYSKVFRCVLRFQPK